MEKNKKDKVDKKEEEKEVEEAKKEVEKLLDLLKNEFGENINIEMRPIKIQKPGIGKTIISFLLSLLLNTFIIFGLHGYIDIISVDNLLMLFLYCTYFSTIQFICEMILMKYFKALIIRTFGLVSIFPILISVVIVAIFPIFGVTTSPLLTMVVLGIVSVIKSIFVKKINELLIRRLINDRKTNSKRNG